jgi:SAM-dependent methyltransferase
MDKEKIFPFEKYTERYERWFIENKFAYWSELEAVGSLLPSGNGFEVGIGSGKFSKPLGIEYGIDPSLQMLKIAKKLGLKVVKAVGENIPFKDKTFDFCLMVTTICFLEDVNQTFKEILRVLKDKGSVIVGFTDKNSEVGKFYLENKDKSPFYKPANFFSVEEVISILEENKFKNFKFKQTIFKPYWQLKSIDKIKDGFGEGSFVVIKGEKA